MVPCLDLTANLAKSSFEDGLMGRGTLGSVQQLLWSTLETRHEPNSRDIDRPKHNFETLQLWTCYLGSLDAPAGGKQHRTPSPLNPRRCRFRLLTDPSPALCGDCCRRLARFSRPPTVLCSPSLLSPHDKQEETWSPCFITTHTTL